MKFIAKKSLGQHFLKSKPALEKIISAADINPGETVLEIGPGTGILTDALLETGAKVIAVEKDVRAFELLSTKYSREYSDGKLVLIRADVLELNYDKFGLSEGSYAVVANIPYYITGMILEKFLEHEPRPNRMILLVQKEVAERIVAKNSEAGKAKGKESVLSISVKAFGTPKIIAKVPRGAFSPPPKVDSAILRIGDISDRLFRDKNVDIKRFFEILKAGFLHKRKYLLRNLETVANPEHIRNAWIKLGLPPRARAEDLSLETWLDLTAILLND